MAGFNTAVTGLKSASTMLDVTGNNIANSSTTGFKSSRTEFADIYATSVVGAGSSNSPGSGVTVSDISQDFSAGTIEFTNNNLDLAINGSGFFQLDDGNGTTTFTRAGAFELDKDGNIVSKNGKYLQGYGLDAQGNILPVQNLAVNQKESAPKPTELIDLSFNIDAAKDPSLLARTFDRDNPASFTYSTTIETVDSLGEPQLLRFYMVEQAPVREVYNYDLSSLISAASSTGSVAISDLTDFGTAFPNGDTEAGTPVEDTKLTFSLRAADGTNPLATLAENVVVAPTISLNSRTSVSMDLASIDPFLNAPTNDGTGTLAAGETLEIGGLTYTATGGENAATVAAAFAALDPLEAANGLLSAPFSGALDTALAGSFVDSGSGTLLFTHSNAETALDVIYTDTVLASTTTPFDSGTVPGASYESTEITLETLPAGETLEINGLKYTATVANDPSVLAEQFADYLQDPSSFNATLGSFDGGWESGFTLVKQVSDSGAGTGTLYVQADIDGNTPLDVDVNVTGTSELNLSDLAASLDATPVSQRADAIAQAINDALGAPEGNDFVAVSRDETTGYYTLSLLAPELVNSGTSFTIDASGDGATNAASLFGFTSGTAVEPSLEPLSISTYELSFDDLLNLEDNLITSPINAANFTTLDDRIDLSTMSYDTKTGILSFELFSEATQAGDVVVQGAGPTSTEVSLVGGAPDERPANEVNTLQIDDTSAAFDIVNPILSTIPVLVEPIELTIGGVPIQLQRGLSASQIGSIIEGNEDEIITKNPNIESVTYNRDTSEVDVVWKAEAGNVETISVSSNSALTGGFGPFTPADGGGIAVEVVNGDASFLGQYRFYAFLNDEKSPLDIGKLLDPGETAGKETEGGPIMIGFDTTSGFLNFVNGESVPFGADAPSIQILGADPTNSTDKLADNDVDNKPGIQLNLTGSTQYAADSIVKAASQDGYPKGDLIGVSFAETGEMVAAFSNGQRQNLGLVAIANFENQSGLQPAGDTEWIATLASGTAVINPPGAGLNGSLRSAALESSNVDLSAELVKLIEAQRNFQANSKTLETMNTVTQAILQI
ncbi:MAG: flagellar hook-basal body complex protein [Oceanospirillaceae bacterium]|nr:flagellar hook-basal body complex protein [Oceanospirillaceae bacterium]